MGVPPAAEAAKKVRPKGDSTQFLPNGAAWPMPFPGHRRSPMRSFSLAFFSFLFLFFFFPIFYFIFYLFFIFLFFAGEAHERPRRYRSWSTSSWTHPFFLAPSSVHIHSFSGLHFCLLPALTHSHSHSLPSLSPHPLSFLSSMESEAP